MARIGLLVLMLGALGLGGWGMSASRTATVTLSIPPLAVLAVPERNLFGKEVAVELSPEDLARGSLLLPVWVKSNVPWAVTAQLLSEEGAELALKVSGGPEVTVGPEEVSFLLGRPGRHELWLHLKIGPETWFPGAKLVLKVIHVGSP